MSEKTTRRKFLQLGALGCAGAALRPAAFTSPYTRGPNRDAKQLKLALNIEMWLHELPFVERIGTAKKLGFDFVEFWPWRNKNLDQIISACAANEVEITQFTGWGFVPGMNNPLNHAKFVEEIEASCIAANKLGAPMMTVVAGNDQPGMTQKEMHENVIAGLNLVKDIAAKHQVMLILE
ncbi:MAG: TIM barrel protein, partial [Planctomycetota bacterium]|nr:TIM barrel protein [Planctomycetota bacterium]